MSFEWQMAGWLKELTKTNNSPLARAGDVAETVHSQIKFRTRANKGRTDLFEIAIPFKLHAQHIRKWGPLRERRNLAFTKSKLIIQVDIQTFKMHVVLALVCIDYTLSRTYRAIETMAVVIQESLFLFQIKLHPVVKTRHLSILNFTCWHTACQPKRDKKQFDSQSHVLTHRLTWKGVLKRAGVLLAVSSRVKTKPHHLQILDKLALWRVYA